MPQRISPSSQSPAAVAARTILLAIFASSTSLAPAQSSTFDRKEVFAPSGHRSMVAVADVDGDGDDDLLGKNAMTAANGVYALSPAYSVVNLNNFAESAGPSPHTAVADFNGDGFLDYWFVYTSTATFYATGGPGGSTTPLTSPFPAALHPANVPAAGDVDGDGDMDAIAVKFANAPIGLALNNGAGGFVDATPTSGLMNAGFGVNALRVVDLDGDGLDDLVVETLTSGAPISLFASSQLGVKVQRSLGGGTFALPVVLPVPTSPSTLPVRFRTRIGDLDGDGLQDVCVQIFASQLQGVTAGVEVIRQTAPFVFASAGFVSVEPYAFDGAPALEVVDLDGDGSDEIVVAGARGTEVRKLVGGLISAPTSWISARAQSLVAADVDGDGDRDVIAVVRRGANAYDYRLLYNDGSGSLAAPSVPGEYREKATSPALLADVDGDGRLDGVSYSGDVAAAALYVARTDDQGLFGWSAPAACVGCLPLASGSLSGYSNVYPSMAAGDLDSDGDTDLVVANVTASDITASSEQVLMNDGTGNFAVTDTVPLGPPVPQQIVTRVVLADLDGDGDLDSVESRWYANSYGDSVRCRFNTGGALGPFLQLPFPSGGAFDVAAVDCDGDGDLDLAAAIKPNQTAFAMNDGAGNYTAVAIGFWLTSFSFNGGLSFGDLDGDGDEDLMWGATAFVRGAPFSFAPAPFAAGIGVASAPSGTVAAGSLLLDYEGDGDLDVVTFRGGGVLSLQVAPGVFVSEGPVGTSAVGAPGRESLPAFGDLDGDDDADLVTRYGEVHYGARRQLSRLLPLRAGATALVEIAGPSFGFALLAVGFGTASATPTPFGALALDPATAVVIVPPTPLDAAGRTTVSTSLSAAAGAALSGMQFTFQAVVDGAEGPRLTNARTTPVYVY